MAPNDDSCAVLTALQQSLDVQGDKMVQYLGKIEAVCMSQCSVLSGVSRSLWFYCNRTKDGLVHEFRSQGTPIP